MLACIHNAWAHIQKLHYKAAQQMYWWCTNWRRRCTLIQYRYACMLLIVIQPFGEPLKLSSFHLKQGVHMHPHVSPSFFIINLISLKVHQCSLIHKKLSLPEPKRRFCRLSVMPLRMVSMSACLVQAIPARTLLSLMMSWSPCIATMEWWTSTRNPSRSVCRYSL